MKLWHGHFIGNFKSPTCPDVPGGKEKNFTTTLQSCRGIVAFDLIWPELAVFCFPSLWSPLCAWGKNLFYNHWPGMFPGTCWTNFFLKFDPTLGRNSWFLAEGQNHCQRHCGFSADFKHFFSWCRPKMIMDAPSIRFLRGCSAPIGCNLNYGRFHENPA